MKFPSKLTGSGRRLLSRRSMLFVCIIGLGVSAVLATALVLKMQNDPGMRPDHSEIGSSIPTRPELKHNERKQSEAEPVEVAEKPLTPPSSTAKPTTAIELQTVESSLEIEEEEGTGKQRFDWFYYQRAYPGKTIPTEAGFRMREQLASEEIRLNELRASNGESAAPEQLAVWAALGPSPIADGQTFANVGTPVSGRITAIALDPGYNGTTNQTVYVGAAQGGVWRSVDNGTHWTPLMDNQPSLAVGAIAVDPTNPNVIYVGTGEGNRAGDTYYGQGLLKTTDGGNTWTQIVGPVSTTPPNLPSFINCSFMTIEIDPSNPQTLYAATNIGLTSGASGGSGIVVIGNRGIWKSTDGGMNWRNLNPGNFTVDRTGTDVLIDPRRPQRVFAAILNVGIFRSEQGGEPNTWTQLSGGLPNSDPNNPTFNRVELAAGPPIAPSTDSTLYVALAAPNDNLLGIWRSVDGGTNWTQVTTPQTQGQANYNLELTVDPTNANVLYYGTQANSLNNAGTVFRSTNGGQSWTDLSRGDGNEGLHADTHAIAVSAANPDIVFTGNDGGIWRTNNAAANTVTWRNLNANLSITQFQTIALHPTNPNFVIGGTQDNGTNIFRGSLTWQHSRGGDGGFTLIDQSNPQVLYHTFFNQNNSNGQRAQIGPEISLNGGNIWLRRGCFGCSTQQGNFNPADRVGFYAPMAQHVGYTSASGNVIYFGTNRLYRSSDQGITWNGLGTSSDGFGADVTKGGTGRLSAIAAHPSLANNQEIVWVGASDGSIQVTTNANAGANATFNNLTKAPLPNRFLTDIALDRNNTQRAVITFSGFNSVTPTTPGHVFLTTNQGQSWTDISGNLPDVPVTSAAINPNDPFTIYIGTDLGVFQTTNGGSTWERLGNGMPRVATFMVRYHAASNSLFAATHGRGVYRLVTSRSLATVSAASFSATSIATESIVAAFGTGMAIRTEVANVVPLPTTLAGTRVVVRDALGAERFSPLFFVAPTQVNFLIPSGTAPGTATISITADDGTVSSGTVEVGNVAPSLFAANSNGREVPAGFALRVTAAGAQLNEPISRFDSAQNKFVPVPIDLGAATDQMFLVLYGGGFRFRSSLTNVAATIGGTPVSVQYAGPQGDFVGLDQLNLLLPRTLIGKGEADLVVTVDGKVANTMRVNIK